MFQFAAAQRSRHSRRSKHRKARPKRAVVGKTGANSGKSTIFGGPIAPSAVIVAPEEIDTIESVLPCSIIPGQSIALKTIGRISNFRPPIIVDLPEMKGLLATSAAREDNRSVERGRHLLFQSRIRAHRHSIPKEACTKAGRVLGLNRHSVRSACENIIPASDASVQERDALSAPCVGS